MKKLLRAFGVFKHHEWPATPNGVLQPREHKPLPTFNIDFEEIYILDAMLLKVGIAVHDLKFFGGAIPVRCMSGQERTRSSVTALRRVIDSPFILGPERHIVHLYIGDTILVQMTNKMFTHFVPRFKTMDYPGKIRQE